MHKPPFIGSRQPKHGSMDLSPHASCEMQADRLTGELQPQCRSAASATGNCGTSWKHCEAPPGRGQDERLAIWHVCNL